MAPGKPWSHQVKPLADQIQGSNLTYETPYSLAIKYKRHVVLECSYYLVFKIKFKQNKVILKTAFTNNPRDKLHLWLL